MFTLNCRGRLLTIQKPLVMGIINLTHDSFFAGSRSASVNDALVQSGKMLSEGATILDLGGQSTRPGATRVPATEELEKLLPVITAIKQQYPEAFISVDTFYAPVAEACIAAGADMVNDITGGNFDSQMIPTVGRLNVPFICMHMKGMPENMQQLAVYDDLLTEVIDYFIQRIEVCWQADINDMIIDPGFGFAKTIAHNFELLQKMEALAILNKPLLAGLSRKATVYKTLGVTPEQALNGTTVLNTIALQKGASILRVHDVREAVECIELTEKMRDKGL
jgi:dihydropteroate synthase